MRRLIGLTLVLAAFFGLTCSNGNKNGGPSFAQLVMSFRTATFHGKYDVRVNNTLAGSIEWFQLPPRTRLDVSILGSTETTLLTPDGNFKCDAGQCQNTSGSEETLAKGFDELLTGTRVVSDSRRIIAERDGFCFDVEATQEINFKTGEVCFDANGFPLLLTGNDGTGETSMEAMELSDRVSSDAFALPN